ncbi:MAG: amidohydrolase [Sporomusaceae bacterium]|nr:amidohydrolase [Sporomusaceae bacterium]
MEQTCIELAKALSETTIARRRDFHKHPETAWTEFRTAALIADVLTDLGYEVQVGAEVVNEAAMMGVPSSEELERCRQRALAEGAKEQWVAKMTGGKTGVVGTLSFAKPGPTVALRFDMDANDLSEVAELDHRPYAEGFASIHQGAMHGCGHDGHSAIGLAVAEILKSLASQLAGQVKLIFQPGEEGVRGAKSMVAAGVVDFVDSILGMHLGVSLTKLGQLSYKTDGFFATTKIDALFQGKAAHAGGAPEQGANALVAAATALLNLQALSRHSQGDSRVNVGVLSGGSGRNVIPDQAFLALEVRGETSEVNQFMKERVLHILEGAAMMQGVTVEHKEMGSAAGCRNDEALARQVETAAVATGLFDEVTAANAGGGSEDFTYFMEGVQAHGGQAVYTMVGTELAAPHHNGRFDFNEAALWRAAAFLSTTVCQLLQSEKQ